MAMPELTQLHDQAVKAVMELSAARESHLAWAAHLRQPHTFGCQGCVDHAAHIGDADYHDEWVAKYDNAISVIAGLVHLVERLKDGLAAIAERASAAEHYGYRDLAEDALNLKGQCEACGRMVPVDELRGGMPAAGVEGSFCQRCRG